MSIYATVVVLAVGKFWKIWIRWTNAEVL